MSASEALAYFTGDFVPLAEAHVPINSHLANYGTGCFEGIRAYWSTSRENLYVTLLPQHAARLLRSARILNLEFTMRQEEVESVVLELLRRNECRSDTYIRPLVYKSGKTIAVALTGIPTSFAAYVLPMGGYFSTTTGLSLRVSGWRRVGDSAIPARAKTIGSYVNAALASDEARRSGFDEAIMLTGEGRLAEAASSNVFLVQDGRLITPAETEDILPGITRAAVLQLAAELGIRAAERPVHRSELFSADEVFLCGTGVEIAPVIDIDGHPIGSGTPGPFAERLRSIYLTILRGDVDDHPEWRTAVYDEPVDVVQRQSPRMQPRERCVVGTADAAAPPIDEQKGA